MRTMMICLAVLLCLAPVGYAGWQYEVRSEMSMPGTGQAMTSRSRGYSDGTRFRFDAIESDNPMQPSGSYVLSTDGGATLYMVNPAEKTYTKLDMAALAGMGKQVSGMMSQMGAQMQIQDHKIEKILEEKGPVIAGFPTRHYKFRTRYTMAMNMFGFSSKTTTITEQDFYTAAGLEGIGMDVWMKKAEIITGNSELDALVKAEMKKVSGTPLKTITVTTTNSDQGGDRVSRMLFEVTQLKKARPAASLFALPQGYREVSMMPQPGQHGRPPAGHPGSAHGQPGQMPDLQKLMKQFQR